MNGVFINAVWLAEKKKKTPFKRLFSFKRSLKRHKTIRFENDTKTVRKRRFGQKKIGVATVRAYFICGKKNFDDFASIGIVCVFHT